MKNFILLLKSYFFYTLSAIGISLTIKANIGVSSFNSMNLALANVASIKVGTVTIIINSILLILYILLTRFKHVKMYFLQAFSVIMFGIFINFFTYTVFKDLILQTYVFKIALISIGTTISGASIGMIIHYNKITFPLESVCMFISEHTHLTFYKLRSGFDVLSVTISVSLSLLFGLPLFVREGTLISMVILSSVMNKTKNIVKSKQIESEKEIELLQQENILTQSK